MLLCLGILILACRLILLGQSNSGQQTPRPPIEKSQSGMQKLCKEDSSDKYKVIAATGIANFIGKLNESGKCGYRLVDLTKMPLSASETFDRMTLVAIVELEGQKKYEYDWFEAFIPGEVQTRINHRAKNGFYFREMLPVAQGLCGTTSDHSPEKSDTERVLDRIVEGLNYLYGGIYFLERRADSNERKEYRVLIGTAGWGKQPTVLLQSELDDKIRLGFWPVAMGLHKILNRYAVSLLVEKGEELHGETSSPSYVIVRSEFGFEKKVNNLAKNGYRIIFDGEFSAFRHALMLKETDKPQRRKYNWIDSTRESFSKKLSDLSKQAVRYAGISSQALGCDFAESRLVFESDQGNSGMASEFKTLKLAEWEQVTDSSNEATLGASTISEQAMREFTKLLDKGYVFRDLFFSNGVHAMFERGRL
jgi:hypothetical protein